MFMWDCRSACMVIIISRVAIFRTPIYLLFSKFLILLLHTKQWIIGCKLKRRKPQPVLQQSVLSNQWTVDDPTVECMKQTKYCLYQEHWVLVEENLLLKKQVVGENHRQAKGRRTALSTASLHLHATGESTAHAHLPISLALPLFTTDDDRCVRMRTADCMCIVWGTCSLNHYLRWEYPVHCSSTLD